MLALAAAPTVWAQAEPPVTHVAIEPQAVTYLDSIAQQSRTARVETAGCVTSYAIHSDTLILERLTPSTRIVRADSANIWSVGPLLCDPGVPAIHSHLTMPAYAWNRPSNQDLLTSRMIGVWELILIVSPTDWHVLVY